MPWRLVWISFMVHFAALPLRVESVYVISNWNSQAETMPSGNLKYVAIWITLQTNHIAIKQIIYI